jgi:hypothetical protein
LRIWGEWPLLSPASKKRKAAEKNWNIELSFQLIGHQNQKGENRTEKVEPTGTRLHLFIFTNIYTHNFRFWNIKMKLKP